MSATLSGREKNSLVNVICFKFLLCQLVLGGLIITPGMTGNWRKMPTQPRTQLLRGPSTNGLERNTERAPRPDRTGKSAGALPAPQGRSKAEKWGRERKRLRSNPSLLDRAIHFWYMPHHYPKVLLSFSFSLLMGAVPAILILFSEEELAYMANLLVGLIDPSLSSRATSVRRGVVKERIL